MTQASNQILTVEQMRSAEEALIDAGTSVDALMRIAGEGAADWVHRMAGPNPVTVLCGPGNNGGDGYVLAESLRRRNVPVVIVAPFEPGTAAARNAKAAYQGEFWTAEGVPRGYLLVDCLFGSGLTRGLDEQLFGLLTDLAASHRKCVAVDLPSGVESDSGRCLNDGLPPYDLTVALGAWKYAHWTMPASARMGERHLVPIGVEPVSGAGQVLQKPLLSPPSPDAHKYTRGLLAVVGGAMPGAGLLACQSAMHGGAGYVKLAADFTPASAPAELVVDHDALADTRLSALLIGPGLGRDGDARSRLDRTLSRDVPLVLDADALTLLEPSLMRARKTPVIATPHEGELITLARNFGLSASGKRGVACALARKCGMVVVAKGPDTLIAAPDGRVVMAPAATSWLSVAGTGDVLAGLIASRLASGAEPMQAASEAVWLHAEAARRSGPVFTASDLVMHLPDAYAACL